MGKGPPPLEQRCPVGGRTLVERVARVGIVGGLRSDLEAGEVLATLESLHVPRAEIDDTFDNRPEPAVFPARLALLGQPSARMSFGATIAAARRCRFAAKRHAFAEFFGGGQTEAGGAAGDKCDAVRYSHALLSRMCLWFRFVR
ncbi:hypothetical protein [Rhodococcus sp. AG1013]|uniref:hypothetical protein n=1 Tax=Rhodococcus sp. AG1013 TaxID=2183996 RepID=UPI0015F0517E|nr:hypothetical protein [Rhodococcus sp. AG1013]